MQRLLATVSFLLTLLTFSFGQDSQPQDSLIVVDQSQAVEVKTKPIGDLADNVAMYSAVLPGLGQAFNKKFWKIPIIVGGGMFIGYYLNFNHSLYVQYRDALLAELDGDPRTESEFARLGFDQNDLERRTDFFRRNRDLLIIASIGVYLLVIVDAQVDAHLSEFTITDDLSLNFAPSVENINGMSNNYGMTLTLKF